MGQGDIQVATADLDKFRDGVLGANGADGLAAKIQKNTQFNTRLVEVDLITNGGKTDFGQGVHGFQSASDLAQRYQDNLTAFRANLTSFLNSLILLGEAAGAISDNYRKAAEFDSVSAKSVDDALAAAQLPKKQ